jgi:CRP/FNR family transcriptional regulator
VKETVVLTITAEAFLKLLYSHPDISIYLLQVFARQLFELGEDVGTRVSDNLIERTRAAVMKFSELAHGGTVTMQIDELATIVGATRYRMVNVLKDLEEEGKVRIVKNIITVI